MDLQNFFDKLNGGARWDVGVSINRSNSLPLDANSVFASLADAQNYAAGTPAEGTLANAYPGQVLAVVTETETIIYYIDANMTLQPVGNTKEIMAYIGNIPEGSDAKTIIEYINAKTEGIATDAALSELQKDVDALEVAVNGKAAVGEEGAEDYEPPVVGLVEKVADIEDTIDGYANRITTDSIVAGGIVTGSVFVNTSDKESIQLHHYPHNGALDPTSTITFEKSNYPEASDKVCLQVDPNFEGQSFITLPSESGTLALVSDIEALDYSKVENVGDGKIKINGEEVVVYAHPEKHAIDDVEGLQDALDKVLEDAQKYADDNDANTTYTLGYESKVDGEGGHPARIVLTPSEGDAQYIDATPFIKDGMIESVALSDDGLKIVITWNTDSDKGENNVTEIPLGDLVDVYTGVDGTTVKVEVSNKNEISAEVKTGSIKDGHIASDAAIAKGKLAADVQASLDLADTALQEADIDDIRKASHTHDFDDADVNDAIDKKHEHKNFDLLETYTQTEADLADAVAKKHGHTFADTDVEDAIAKTHEHTFLETELNKIVSGDVDKWNAAEAKAHEHGNKTLLDAITDERVAKWDEAEANLFDAIDVNYFYIDATEDGEEFLTLEERTKAAIDDLGGLKNKAGETALLSEVLAEKVNAEEGKGLSSNDFTDTLLGKLNGIEAGAQVNVIEGITFNGVAVPVGEGKIADITYTLPIADADTLGGVKSSEAENKITVANDGTMEVASLNVNKLVQSPNEYLILNGGGASI